MWFEYAWQPDSYLESRHTPVAMTASDLSFNRVLRISISFAVADAVHVTLSRFLDVWELCALCLGVTVVLSQFDRYFIGVPQFVAVRAVVSEIKLNSGPPPYVIGVNLSSFVEVVSALLLFTCFARMSDTFDVLKATGSYSRRVYAFLLVLMVEKFHSAVAVSYSYTSLIAVSAVVLAALDYMRVRERESVPPLMQVAVYCTCMYVIVSVLDIVSDHGLIAMLTAQFGFVVIMLHLSDNTLALLKPVVVWKTSQRVAVHVVDSGVTFDVVVIVTLCLSLLSFLVGIRGVALEVFVHTCIQIVVVYGLKFEFFLASQPGLYAYILIVIGNIVNTVAK